jgi:hypothetical protein
MLSICRHTGSALCAAFAPSDLFGDQTGLHAHAIRERQNASAADETHALFAAVAWLECSCRAADGTLTYEGRWAALVDQTSLEARLHARPRGDDLIDQTSLEAAVAADDAARAEAVATWLRALVAHLLPKTAPVYAPDTASSGGAVAPETAPALASAVTAAQDGAVTAAQIGAAAAADAVSVLVLQLMTKHVLPALQRAAAAEGACAASEGLWEEASEL